MGLQVAKGLAFVHGKPLVPVHHIAGHLQAAVPGRPRARCPCPRVALVVSGGHTSLFAVRLPAIFRLLGRTRDDAAGEAFDKVAKLLGLGYPGGPAIDRLARTGNPEPHDFPIAQLQDGTHFSFSGIKTAVLYHVRRQGILPVAEGASPSKEVRDLAASFQRAVVTALVRRLVQAAEKHRPQSLLVTGGVAANSLLREEASRAAEALGLPLFVPPMGLSTDNAAMIAAAAQVAYDHGVRADWDLNAEPHLPLGVARS